MKSIISIGTMAALFLSLTLAVSAKIDLSGTWKLDQAKSEGLPPGMNQTMTVTQTDDKISLETKMVSEKGEQTVSDSYLLNGKETEFSQKTPNGTGKGKRTANWTADGIEVKESIVFATENGDATVQLSRKWMLSADGKTLAIEITSQNPNGTHKTKRFFTKK
ncbi:MAG TPA: hypothetical protein VF692_12365 [Pyrinomonadaceae bacterium]|jgi:hypothetical protein